MMQTLVESFCNAEDIVVFLMMWLNERASSDGEFAGVSRDCVIYCSCGL